MKKPLFKQLTTALFIITLTGGGIFTSCQKDDPVKPEQFDITTSDDAQLEQEIARFKSEMINPRKSGGVMNFGQALWMMEATFNYFHSFVSENFLTTITDTTYIEVNYTLADEIPLGELAELFIETNNTIAGQYQTCELPNKKPMLFDLEHEATTNGYRLAVMTTMGQVDSRKSTNIDYDNPFGSTDYWKPLFAEGKCGPYEGQMVGQDAATQWESKLRMKYNHTCCYYFTDLESKMLYLNDETDPNRFYAGTMSCVNPDDMNFYFQGMDYYIQLNQPSGKTLSNCVVFNEFVTQSYHWRNNLETATYGIKKRKYYEEVPSEPSTLP